MILNQAGIDLIKKFEGCQLTAYFDPGTGGVPWTIGYGHTGGVNKGDICTQEQADQWLANDCACTAAELLGYISLSGSSVQLNDNQFSALVAFCYNVKSWTGRPMFQHLLRGDFDGAKQHWAMFNRANGIVLPGLSARRLAEITLFDTPVES